MKNDNAIETFILLFSTGHIECMYVCLFFQTFHHWVTYIKIGCTIVHCMSGRQSTKNPEVVSTNKIMIT